VKAPTKASRRNLPAAARVLIANARNDITIPRFTTTLRPLDETLLAKGGARGLALYDEIERDTHAYAVLSKRKHQLVSREWTIEPGGDTAADAAAAALAEEVLGSLPFDRLSLDLLDATLKGYAVAEIVWMRDGARIVPERIVAHDPRRFVFDLDWQPRLITTEAMTDGIPLPARNFIVHRFGVRGNNPYGLGLGSKLFWAVLFKREGVAFWLHFLERFAAPTPVGKHPLGMLPQDQTKLLNNLLAMVQAGALVAPIGTEVSFLEASRAGNAGYSEWCGYWDTQMALCVFGSTLATYVEGQGSRAASETHKEAEEQIIDADGDLLSDTLGASFVKWLVDYNLPGAGVPSVRRLRARTRSSRRSCGRSGRRMPSSNSSCCSTSPARCRRIASRKWLPGSPASTSCRTCRSRCCASLLLTSPAPASICSTRHGAASWTMPSRPALTTRKISRGCVRSHSRPAMVLTVMITAWPISRRSSVASRRRHWRHGSIASAASWTMPSQLVRIWRSSASAC
jgi:hypothetical protein